MATVASLFRDAVQVTPAAEQVDALPAASMVALPDELLRHIFRQACNVLEPRCAVALSSASHGLWALTQEGRQQLKADHEAATAAAEVNCTICNQRWPSLLMLQHMGYHQLHTPEKMCRPTRAASAAAMPPCAGAGSTGAAAQLSKRSPSACCWAAWRARSR